jgi:S1-C subfamily serine protease
MRKISIAVIPALIVFATLSNSSLADTFRFIKSQSGPSGRIAENRFVFDEVRNRFVYPQDKSLTVSFEWEAPLGNHTLSAFWKDPEGRVASISPDVKMEIKTSLLQAYWVYELVSGMRNGIWTVEIRIDGEPAGSHSFELVSSEPSKTETAPSAPKLPSLDEIYASVGNSLVWVYKLDDAGGRTDTSIGFVIASGQVATAFQAIDETMRVEVEFADGHKLTTEEVWACNRLQDWAVLKIDTGATPVLRKMENTTVPVGERYLVFNVEHERARVIGGVDITGKRSVPGFGDRIQLTPGLTREAVGGPLLNSSGLVAGIVGGGTTPGSRFSRKAMTVSRALWSRSDGDIAATPIAAVPNPSGAQYTTFRSLLDSGVLTPPLTPIPSLVFGGSAKSISKDPNDMSTSDTSEFSRKDKAAWIYTLWQKKEKNAKGLVSAKVYDYRNHLLVDVAPKKISAPDGPPARVAFDFALANFTAGIYRIDVLWNGQPAWRTFFTIID